MIEAIEGRGVGSGKTYYVVARRILQHLAQGGYVYASNTLDLCWEQCREYCAERWAVEIEREQYVSFPNEDVPRLHEVTPAGTAERPVLVVVDEAQIALNARDWAEKGKRAFFAWLTQSRHDDTDVVMITQHIHNIDAQILRLCTYITRVRNMENFSVPGLGKWPLKQFVASRYDSDGKTLMEKVWLKHDPKVFAAYRSKACRGSHKRAGELPPKQLKRSKKGTSKRMLKVLVAMVVVLFAVGGVLLHKAFGRDNTRAAVLKTPKQHGLVHDVVREDVPRKRAEQQPERVLYVTERMKWFSDRRRVITHEGPPRLETDRQIYLTGAPCSYGLVMSVHCPDLGRTHAWAKVQAPDGSTVIVTTGQPVASVQAER